MSKITDTRPDPTERRIAAATFSPDSLLLFQNMLEAMTLSAAAPNLLEVASRIDRARRELADALAQAGIEPSLPGEPA